MERKIGEIFEYNGEWYQCIKDDYLQECISCAFYNKGYFSCEEGSPECRGHKRNDKTDVIFKKHEKVGSTLGINKKTYQCIKPIYHKGCTGCTFEKSCRHICRGQGIYVEIKTKRRYGRK